MIKPMNPLSLLVFAEVVQRGSFTLAGPRLNLSQPAISFHIRALEDRYGVPLLERRGRTVIPTVAGSALLTHAKEVTAALATTERTMVQFRNLPDGTLRIGTGTTYCMAVLPTVIRQLRDRLPALRLDVTTATTPAIVQGLEGDRFDVGIVTIPVGGQGLRITALLEDEVVLLAPLACDLPTTLTPAHVATLHPMMFEPLGMTRALIDGWFQAAGVSFHPTVSKRFGNSSAWSWVRPCSPAWHSGPPGPPMPRRSVR
jgi:DNA-binding transcriptional LysR family regulator